MYSSHDNPFSPSHRAAAGAVAGFAAGALLSAAWLGMEASTGETAEVVRLGRRGLAEAGAGTRRETARPDAGEQILSHGGHLLLSAAAGAAYGAAVPADAPPLLAGAGFGAGFYALAYGVLAPALRLRPPVWRDARTKLAQRGFFHLLFGVLVAELTPIIAKNW